MRPRKWVLVLLCVAAVTITVATWGMRFFERRLGLEAIIAEHVRPLAGGDVNIGSVKFGFFIRVSQRRTRYTSAPVTRH